MVVVVVVVQRAGGRTFSRKPSRSATASLSLSASTGSYMLSLERAAEGDGQLARLRQGMQLREY